MMNCTEAKMDLQVFKTIREREQKVLGIYSFSEPIVPKRGRATTYLTDGETPQKMRRNQVLQAQRYGVFTSDIPIKYD